MSTLALRAELVSLGKRSPARWVWSMSMLAPRVTLPGSPTSALAIRATPWSEMAEPPMDKPSTDARFDMFASKIVKALLIR